jgi:uncharacterized tellurite resistance protein B-like protein
MMRRVVDALRTVSKGEGPSDREYDAIVAVSALFMEMAAVDGEFSEEERKRIVAILRDEYQLFLDDAVELMEQAEREVDQAIPHWQYAELIKKNYSAEERAHLVELLWKIVLADGQIATHEEYLLNNLGEMLAVPKEEIMAAKARALSGA